MKITKRQLRRIIKEEKALLMEEPSDYYKDYRAGLITRQEYEALVRQYNERESSYSYRPRRPRKTKKVGFEATRERLDVIRRVRAKKDSKFLLSISNQLSSGRDLTDKQNAIVRKIVAKHEPESASLFESKVLEITEEEIRRIIKEEKAKMLKENTPVRNAEYQQGSFANVNLVSAVTNGIEALFEQVVNDASEDLGDDQEGDIAAANVVTYTVIEAFQRIGLIGQAREMEKFLE